MTKEAVQNKINPQAVGTSVSKLEFIQNGSVVISCDVIGIGKIRKAAEMKLGRQCKVTSLKNSIVKLLY